MFSENLKILRKAKGLSQEELADRIHVVRQTISKWEKGLSVPDAAMLITLADVFETSVSALLGDNITEPQNKNSIAEKLEQLNLQLAERNKRNRTIWRVVVGVFIGLLGVMVLSIVLSYGAFSIVSGSEITTGNETIMIENS